MPALLALLAIAALPAPGVVAAPIQDSPAGVQITLRGGARRALCAVDGGRPAACTSRTRFKLAPGRHSIAVRGVDARGRRSPARTVAVVAAERAPAPVAVGGQPVGIAASAGALWISGGSSGEVVRLDPATRAVTARVQTGAAQLGSVFAGSGGVWVGDFGAGGLVRVAPASNTVTARVSVGGQPTSIAAAPSGELWVGNLAGDLARVDPATATLLPPVSFSGGTSWLLFTATGLWVGTQAGSLDQLDPATGAIAGSVTIGTDVDAIAETPDGLWVTTFDGRAALVDPQTGRVVRRVALPGKGSGVAYADGGVYVSVYDRGLVLRLDSTTGVVTRAIHTGAQPRESVVLGSSLWVVDQAAGMVTPIAL